MTDTDNELRDDLADYIAERAKREPDLPRLVDAVLSRRLLIHDLAERRRSLGLTQTEVGARMGTSQSVIARLEGGEVDPKMSTIERYAVALDAGISWEITEQSETAAPRERAAS